MLNEYEILEDVESFEECGEVAENTTVPATTTWICDDVPMALYLETWIQMRHWKRRIESTISL